MALNNKDLERAKKLVQEINAEYAKMGKAIRFPEPTFETSIADLKQIQDIYDDINQSIEESTQATRDLEAETKELFGAIGAVNDEIQNYNLGYKMAVKAANNLTSLTGDLVDIQSGLKEANSRDLVALQNKVLAEKKNLELSKTLLQNKAALEGLNKKEQAALDNIQGALNRTDGLYGQITKNLEDVVEEEIKVEKQMGLIGASADGLNKVLPSGIGDRLGIGDALKDTRAMVKASGGNVSKMQAMNHLAQGLGKNLMKSLGPYALIAIAIDQIVKAFKMVDQQSGEVAKNLGISAKEGQALVFESNEVAMDFDDIAVSGQDIVKSQMQLNKIFGTSAKFAGDIAAEFASVSERTGLSEGAMKKFAEGAMIGGKTIKDQLISATAVTQELNAQNKVSFNAKDIQEGIGEMSKAQLLSNRMNTKEMANQVFQQKMLGISAAQLEGVQGSLLEFESSIAAEMEAELLTGKQLNLENARAAALAGDQARLAQEIRKEVGTAAEFGEMNVIQQEALAKAFGMSREDMAGMLVEQEKVAAMQKAFGGDIKTASEAQAEFNRLQAAGLLTEEKKKELAEAGVLAQMESQSATERLAAVTEKLQGLFVMILEPLMPIVDLLMTVLEDTLKPMMPIVKGLGDLLGGLLAPIMKTLLQPTMLIMDLFKQIGEMISEILPEGTEMGSIFSSIGSILGSIISIGLLPMQAVIRLIIENVQSMMSIFGGFIKIFQGDFQEGFKMIASGAIGLLLAPFQVLTDLVMGAINLIIDGLNTIPLVDIPNVESPDLAGLVTGAVGLAEGGIISAKAGGTPAIIGEGGEDEVVMPLSKLADMLPSIASVADPLGVASGIGSVVGGIGSAIGGLFGGGEEEIGNAEIISELKAIRLAIEKGGDVYIDGAKAGKSMALATSKIG